MKHKNILKIQNKVDMVFYFIIAKVIVIYKLDVYGLLMKLSKSFLNKFDIDDLDWLPRC